MLDIEKNKEKFCALLRGTGRKGVDEVITGLEKLGFFEAPASSKFHLAEKGGLCAHSLNVYEQALSIMSSMSVPGFKERVTIESVVIASLLHDVCKAEIYKVETKRRRRPDGVWEDYQGYSVDYSHFPMGHGEKSVTRLLLLGLEMTQEEMLAIRWHMSNWSLSQDSESKGNYGAAQDKCELLAVITAADVLATAIGEGPIASKFYADRQGIG